MNKLYLVPDGYHPDGIARKWILCELVGAKGNVLKLKRKTDGLIMYCPDYSVQRVK